MEGDQGEEGHVFSTRNGEIMKIGLDIHGVIDRFPRDFALLTKRWVEDFGHEVHIVTGAPLAEVSEQIKGITYTHLFSIVDHHLSIGTPMEFRKTGWWMADDVWKASKGNYASTVGLDVHLDDTLSYAASFPESCMFIYVDLEFADALWMLGNLSSAANPREALPVKSEHRVMNKKDILRTVKGLLRVIRHPQFGASINFNEWNTVEDADAIVAQLENEVIADENDRRSKTVGS